MDIFEIRHRNLMTIIESLDARGLVKQRDQALHLNMSPSYLSQLKKGKKLGEDVARKIEIDMRRPRGWLDQPQWTAPGKDSQPVILDPLIIAETHKALRELKKERGLALFLEDPADAARFVLLYRERIALSDQPSNEELIRYGRKVESIGVAIGAASDGRSDGVPTEGTGKTAVSRGLRKKG